MTTVAAIDCGTNAVRMLIMDRDAQGVDHEVLRIMRTVRLGEGVDSTGLLSEAALGRTFAALDEYAHLLRVNEVDKVRMVATSATRDAANREQFVAGVHERLGVQPEVITGDMEAQLSFAGAMAGLEAGRHQPRFLVVDIGGGSTEFVLGDDEPQRWVSIDVGCVRMTERHLAGDPPTSTEVSDARADIASAVAMADDAIDFDRARTLVGLAGSVTTVAAHALDLPAYDESVLHGSVISLASVDRATDAYIAMSRSERAALPYMHPGRVDVIAGGAMVLQEIMHRGRFAEVVVSERDILDGIAYSLM